MDRTEIDEGLVRSLLEDQHPDLAGLDLRRAAIGWDNELWRLGDDLAVRLPYATERAGELLRKEYRWLPELAPRLPLPVPTPTRIGEPSVRFAEPWTVVRWVPGEPADRTPVGRGPEAADTLAGFLRALHRPAPADAPLSPDRGIPLKAVTDGFDRGVEAVSADWADRIDVAGMRKVWDQAVAAPEWDGPPLWIHADLHPANVVVADGTLAGVVDFGELCAGDPATDLGAAWLLLPEGAAAGFLDTYAVADEASVRRARGWALRACLGLLSVGRAGELGLPGGKPSWGPAGQAAVERVLAFDPV
ncbi:aminoglycoside phosphotransferase family protein [Streptacidiphilus carbonis]|uniref:aminoglycoside phosphotransferase family protein n=1 Tax=Streptacidiphilus carbonis TaxID=105422 RepID=UPI0005A8B489|nr:aminoglycoside phosphotransferase family protein [Streptacidiphilus carbonis]